jgi:raffinose/stachyose/melibiose transport system permease protein
MKSSSFRSKKIITGIKYTILCFYAATTLYPLIWVFLTSLKADSEVYGNPFGLPRAWKFSNFKTVWETMKLYIYMTNSILYTCCALFIILLITSMAAYVLARTMKSRKLSLYFTIGIMVPFQSIVIPYIQLYRKINFYNTRYGVILSFVAINLAFSIFILTAFMKTLPIEIEEAARIDGCGRVRTFFSIILPVSKAGLSTVGIFAAVNCWNDFFVTMMTTSTEAIRTLNLACYQLRASGDRASQYGVMCAGAVILVLPILFVYITFQKQIVKGMVAGAVKG